MNIATSEKSSVDDFFVKHLLFGWWSLFCFVVLGIALETMHGFKIGWYLEEAYSTRRLMWTLGHAHGTLLSLVHIAFAGTLSIVPDTFSRSCQIASTCLTGGTILMPGGFFLGGIFIYDGDPGVGVWFVPIGAFLILTSVFLTACGTMRARNVNHQSDASDEIS